MSKILMDGFSGIVDIRKKRLGRRSSDDERQIKRWVSIVSRFKGILSCMIKDKGTKFDDYTISPKVRQTLLHWGYELVESDCF